MRIVPEGRIDRLQYYETHLPRWAQDPQGIGTSDEYIAQLAAAATEAREAHRQQQQLQQQAKSATMRFNRAIDALAEMGGSIMMQIRSKAGRERDPSVYARASVPPPKKKSRIAPPGQPHSFTFNARQDGTLKLKWKCRVPRGSTQTIYHVSRSIGAPNQYVVIGHNGKKEFLDETIPHGATIVYYRVWAVRSTCEGEAGEHFLRFGTDGKVKAKMVTKRAA